jgi:hypothetical protein
LGIRRTTQFAHDKTDDDVRFFEEEFPDALPLMPNLLDDFRNDPTGSLVTIRCARGFTRTRPALSATPRTGSYHFIARDECCLPKRRRATDLAIGNFIEMRD